MIKQKNYTDYVGIINQRKVIDGKLYRRYFVNSEGIEVGIPLGVRMCKDPNTNHTYVLWAKGHNTSDAGVFISYVDKHTQEQALVKCINTINTYSAGKNTTCCSTRTKRSSGSSHPAFNVDLSDIPVGISVQTSNRQPLQMSLVVSYFDSSKYKFATKTMYVGTINTWKERYHTKLNEAKTLREESLKLYNQLTRESK